jgi:hypothetical protein
MVTGSGNTGVVRLACPRPTWQPIRRDELIQTQSWLRHAPRLCAPHRHVPPPRRARDGEGRSCLVDALRLTRQRLNIRGDRTRAYLTRAIRQHRRGGRLQEFNDYLCSGIEEVRATIRFAYALAAVYPPDRLPYAPTKPTCYSPSTRPCAFGLAHLEWRSSLTAASGVRTFLSLTICPAAQRGFGSHYFDNRYE